VKLAICLIGLNIVLAENGCTQGLVENPLRIPGGAKIEIQWIAPPDTDVVQYKVYFTTDIGEKDTLSVDKWWEQDSTSMVVYEQHLPLGLGHVEMTAIDRSGNESDRSDKFYYEIYDQQPGKPSMIMIKIVN